MLSYAIDREREAAGQYELFSRTAKKPPTKAMFDELAREERGHQTRLEAIDSEALKSCSQKQIAFSPSSAGSEGKFDPDMDFVAALRLAIQKEEEAARLYDSLRAEAGDDKLCSLLSALVEQERGHRAKLQDELDSVVLKDY